RDKVIEPVFEAKSDYEILYRFATKLGFGNELVKNIAVVNNEPVAEDILREINRGAWSIGYSGQSPERLKLHMQHQDKFDVTTSIGLSEPVKGEDYGLPWPCWGTPELRHPATPLLYDQSKPVPPGSMRFGAARGVRYEGEAPPADCCARPGAEVNGGRPETTAALLQSMARADELTAEEMPTTRQVAMNTMAAHQPSQAP